MSLRFLRFLFSTQQVLQSLMLRVIFCIVLMLYMHMQSIRRQMEQRRRFLLMVRIQIQIIGLHLLRLSIINSALMLMPMLPVAREQQNSDLQLPTRQEWYSISMLMFLRTTLLRHLLYQLLVMARMDQMNRQLSLRLLQTLSGHIRII